MTNSKYVEEFHCKRCFGWVMIRAGGYDAARRELKRAGWRWLHRAWVCEKCVEKEEGGGSESLKEMFRF